MYMYNVHGYEYIYSKLAPAKYCNLPIQIVPNPSKFIVLYFQPVLPTILADISGQNQNH